MEVREPGPDGDNNGLDDEWRHICRWRHAEFRRVPYQRIVEFRPVLANRRRHAKHGLHGLDYDSPAVSVLDRGFFWHGGKTGWFAQDGPRIA